MQQSGHVGQLSMLCSARILCRKHGKRLQTNKKGPDLTGCCAPTAAGMFSGSADFLSTMLYLAEWHFLGSPVCDQYELLKSHNLPSCEVHSLNCREAKIFRSTYWILMPNSHWNSVGIRCLIPLGASENLTLGDRSKVTQWRIQK